MLRRFWSYQMNMKGSFMRSFELRRSYSCSSVTSCKSIVGFEIPSISTLENKSQSSFRYLGRETHSKRSGKTPSMHQEQSPCTCLRIIPLDCSILNVSTKIRLSSFRHPAFFLLVGLSSLAPWVTAMRKVHVCK